MHILRSGLERPPRGFVRQSHAGTRPVPLRRIGARPLHVGASGSHRTGACRPEVLHRVPIRVGGGNPTRLSDGAC